MSDDERAIIDLTIAYTWALDDRRFEALHDVFAPDATGDLAGVHCEGIDAILERIQRGLSKRDATQHVISNHQVRVDGDAATCRCYWSASTSSRARRAATTHHERDLLRPAGPPARGWRIVHRTLEILWTEGNPAVVGR